MQFHCGELGLHTAASNWFLAQRGLAGTNTKKPLVAMLAVQLCPCGHAISCTTSQPIINRTLTPQTALGLSDDLSEKMVGVIQNVTWLCRSIFPPVNCDDKENSEVFPPCDQCGWRLPRALIDPQKRPTYGKKAVTLSFLFVWQDKLRIPLSVCACFFFLSFEHTISSLLDQ